jgi:hypothetical protein
LRGKGGKAKFTGKPKQFVRVFRRENWRSIVLREIMAEIDTARRKAKSATLNVVDLKTNLFNQSCLIEASSAIFLLRESPRWHGARQSSPQFLKSSTRSSLQPIRSTSLASHDFVSAKPAHAPFVHKRTPSQPKTSFLRRTPSSRHMISSLSTTIFAP